MKKIMALVFFLSVSLYAQESLYALKGGVLSHSTGPVSSGREEGVDLNIELLFNTYVLKAHPSIGTDINLNGDTSFVYAGLSWEGKFFQYLLLGAFFGVAAHNGSLDDSDADKRQFGTRIVFREAVDIGFYLHDDISLSLMYDHYSNAGLSGKQNQGNDNIGLRISYYF